MDSGLLDFLKGVTIIQAGVIAGIAIGALSWIRRVIRKDNREDLGLKDGESLQDKINASVAAGFSAAVHPLTMVLQGHERTIAEIQLEQKGQRVALANHGEQIGILGLEVASLTSQVGGPPAVHALRSRIERKQAEKKEIP